MSMSDCPACWQTPCCCGDEWRKMDLAYLKVHRAMIDQVIREKEQGTGPMPSRYEAPITIGDWQKGERWRMVDGVKVYRTYDDYVED